MTSHIAISAIAGIDGSWRPTAVLRNMAISIAYSTKVSFPTLDEPILRTVCKNVSSLIAVGACVVFVICAALLILIEVVTLRCGMSFFFDNGCTRCNSLLYDLVSHKVGNSPTCNSGLNAHVACMWCIVPCHPGYSLDSGPGFDYILDCSYALPLLLS